jgi:Fic family protein
MIPADQRIERGTSWQAMALAQAPATAALQGHDARYGDFAYFAFLAAPLPHDVQLDSATWTAVTEAAASVAKLDQACQQLPDPRLLIRPSLWKEALDTSALEGTVGALQDLLEARLPSTRFLSPETVEIRAYERVALEAFSLIKERPITVGLLCELQGQLFADVNDPPRDAGRVRQDTVWIGEPERPIQDSRFVPAPGDDRLRAGMDSWEKWVLREHPHLAPVLRTALAHYQFETLHPFSDGNGRLGRLVVVLQFLRAGALQEPAMNVSPWFLKRREEYQDQLLAVSRTGDWNPWVEFFCQAVCEQSASLIRGAEQLVSWLNESRRKVQERRWTGAIHNLLEDLVEWPITTIADTADRYGVTPMNATRMIAHLEEIGVVTELTGKNYGRIFGATEVMRAVEEI